MTPTPRRGSSETRAGPNAPLGGRHLVIARTAWATLITLALGLFVLSVPSRYGQLTALASRASAKLDPGDGLLQRFLMHGAYALTVLSLEVAFVLAFALVSAAIVWRNSSDWRTLFFSAVFVTYSVWVTPTLDALTLPSILQTVADLTQAAGLLLAVSFFLLFPDGCFVPGWTRLNMFAWAVYCLVWSLFPAAWFSLRDPFHTSFAAFLILMLLGWGAGLFAQAVRFRRIGVRQRVQTKWVLIVIAAACVGYATVYLPDIFLPASGSFRILYELFGVPVFLLLALPIPITLFFAMQRYHLFNVQLILRRTLIYTMLTGALALIYVGSVVLLQEIFRLLAGQKSQLAIVASTLAIAVLFRPLQWRIQAAIDCRFYRGKYDAAKTLASFSESLRSKTDLNELRNDLVAVVRETMQPTHISLWLRPPESREGEKDKAKNLENIPKTQFRNAFRNGWETLGT